MSRVILISVSPGEAWAALCEDDALVELRVARAGRTARAGEIVLGRVVALKPELPAALVDIGEKRPAFLSGEDAAQGLTEGQPVVAQVTKEARADKATTISMRVRLQGALLGLVPGGRVEVTGRGMHVDEKERLMKEVVRLARPGEGFRIGAVAFAAPREDLASDVDALRARWQAIEAARQGARPPARLEPEEPPFLALLAALATPPLNRIVIDDRGALAEARSWLKRHLPDLVPALELHDVAMPLFELEGMASQIETALSPRVALPGGGALTIEAGAVAVTIDVDSGGAPVMATNLAAAKEAARQIRLRNCAGAIVIDFIAMKERGRTRARRGNAQASGGERSGRAGPLGLDPARAFRAGAEAAPSGARGAALRAHARGRPGQDGADGGARGAARGGAGSESAARARHRLASRARAGVVPRRGRGETGADRARGAARAADLDHVRAGTARARFIRHRPGLTLSIPPWTMRPPSRARGPARFAASRPTPNSGRSARRAAAPSISGAGSTGATASRARTAPRTRPPREA